jgi:hypothetical protein
MRCRPASLLAFVRSFTCIVVVIAAAAAAAASRRQVGPVSLTPPPAAPIAPGVSLNGSRLLLSGAPALACLRGEALGHVSHLTLEHMAYSKVRGCVGWGKCGPQVQITLTHKHSIVVALYGCSAGL